MKRTESFAGLLLLLVGSGIRSQEADPLPAGAVRRLGTARLRHPEASQVRFVQAGKAILSAGADGCVRLWDVKTGRELHRFAGSHPLIKDRMAGINPGPLLHFHLSADEKILATSDSAVRVWDMTTGQELSCSPLARHHKPYLESRLAITRDGRFLVAALLTETIKEGRPGNSHKVHTWDLKTGKIIHEWTINDGSPYNFLSPDAKMVVNNTGAQGFKVRDSASGKLLRDWPFTLYSRSIFSPDSQTLVGLMFGDQDFDFKSGLLVGRDIKTGKDTFKIRTTSNTWAWFFSPDGKILATGPGLLLPNDNQPLLIFEAASGKILQKFAVDKEGYQHVVFSADNKRLAISEAHKRIRIWNLDTGKKIGDIPCRIGQYTSFDLSPDGTVLAVGVGPCLQLWDTRTGKRLLQQEAHERPPVALTFSADGKGLVSIDEDAVAHIWNLQTGRHRQRLDAPPPGDQYHYYPFEKPILFLSPQGKVQALGMSRNRWGNQEGHSHTMVHQVDLATQKLVRSYGSHQTPIGSFAISRDGKTLAGVIGRHIHLWDTETGKERRVLVWREEIPKEQQDTLGLLARSPLLAFSPDGRIIACRRHRQVAADKVLTSITLWEIASGKIRQRFEGELSRVVWGGGGVRQAPFPVFDDNGSLVLSPDGKTAALGSGDTIRLWDLGGNREIRRFGGEVRSEHAAFSPDGKLLAAPARDGSLALWDVATGTVLEPIRTPGLITSFRFSPDGRTIATGGEDTAVMLWDLAHFSTPAKAALPSPNFEALWNDLAGDDGIKSGQAVLAFSQGGADSVAFLKNRLQPIAPPDGKQVRKLFADLEHGEFKVRDQARRELEKLGDLALPVLRKLDKSKLGLEGQRRLAALVEKVQGQDLSPQMTRTLRAIEALEHIGSAEALRILELLASGSPEHRVTLAASEASNRLRLRQVH